MAVNSATLSIAAKIPIEGGSTPAASVASPDHTKLYVTRTGPRGRDVLIVDTLTATVAGRIPLDPAPLGGIAISADGSRLYVAQGANGATPYSIAFIDTASNTVVANVPMTERPNEIAVRPGGAELYVTLHNAVAVIATGSQSIVATIPVGVDTRAIKFAPNGLRAYVACHQSSTVDVIDTVARSVVASVLLWNNHDIRNGPDDLAIAPDGGRLYVS